MSVFYQSKILQTPTEEMQNGGNVKPRKMDRGGTTSGGYEDTFELPENLQELIGYAPQNTTSPITVDASTPVTVDERGLTLTPAQRARLAEDLTISDFFDGMFPTTEGAAERLQGDQDPYYDDSYVNVNDPREDLPLGPVYEGPEFGGETIQENIQKRIEEGSLTAEAIQTMVNSELLTKDDVLTIMNTGFQFSEEQMAQLFSQGTLTREEIAALVNEAVAEEDVAEIAAASGMTEEQINELISQQMSGQDMSQFVTQPQLQEQISGLESLFQNYLTPEQLQGYLNDQDTETDQTIQELQNKLGTLEQQYQDVTSQYEADAVQNQIDQTKDDLNTYFASAAPTGPRTGSTSQFSSGASFLPGGSPMANLIQSQREGQEQDPFSTYLKTSTPSYSDYNAPFTAEEYSNRNQPLLGTQYSNPFTGGSSYTGANGGQVSSNGIMDLTNFDTNVQPFQNAFRPNKPRT